MASFASSYQPSFGAGVKRNTDVLPLPFLARPQAMTIYVRFMELGTRLAAASTRLLSIANAAGDTPRFAIDNSATNTYQLLHRNGAGTTVTASVSGQGGLGSIIELRAVLQSDGSIFIGQSIDAATETVSSTSSAAVLASAWSGQLIWFNSFGTSSSFRGFVGFRELVIHRGVQNLATMRRVAVVPT